MVTANHASSNRPLDDVYAHIECVRSCDQKPYLHNETKRGICIKVEFNLQKNISLFQDDRRLFVYSSNMASVTSGEHTLFCTDWLVCPYKSVQSQFTSGFVPTSFVWSTYPVTVNPKGNKEMKVLIIGKEMSFSC